MRPRFCSRSEKIPACVQRCAAGILNYPRNQQPRQFTLAGFFFAGYESVVRSDSAVLGSAAVFLRLAPHAVHVGLFISPRAARDPREKRLTAATGLTAFFKSFRNRWTDTSLGGSDGVKFIPISPPLFAPAMYRCRHR